MFTLSIIGLLSFGAHGQREEFDRNMLSGYDAVASADYDLALNYFKTASKSPVLKKPGEEGLKMFVDELIKLINRRKSLGTIHPQYVHRSMVLYVNKVELEHVDDQGEKHLVKEEMDDEAKSQARITQLVTKTLYEAMSQGNFSIDFVEQEVETPVRSYFLNRAGKPSPDWLRFEEAGPIFLRNLDDFDSFIWCSTAIHGGGHGGSGRFPVGMGELSPNRGYIVLNPRHSVNLWVHEFFHIVERMVGISPVHGHHKENKDKFPEWKGEVNNSLNYYDWHFNTTIPTKGWNQLGFEKRFSPLDLDGFSPVGTWQASEIKEDWQELTWELELKESDSPELEVILLYTRGWKALDIAWVAVYVGDDQVSIDEHTGFSGSRKTNILYSLPLRNLQTNRVLLKAKVKGNGGTDSNGLVLVK